jgi:hypothetical protein
MGFLSNLFGSRPKDTVVLQPKKPQKPPARSTRTEVVPTREEIPPVLDEYMPDMLDLG